MKLAVLLLMLTVFCTIVTNGMAKSTSKSTNEDLLERAAMQLERLSAFRRTKEPYENVLEDRLDDNGAKEPSGESLTPEDIREAQKRIDDLRTSASELLQDPNYEAIMQDRIKRSFISGIANKLIGGAVGASSGASRGISSLSTSNSPSEYGSYGHPYGTPKTFDIWDFKKAIINTVIQAIKAIGGGAIAGGGALVKGGGFLVSAKGRIISSAGDAITSLGKALASSAIIASPKPVYGPPGYSYNHQTIEHPSHDITYDGPPPSADAYVGPEDGYNAGHSSFNAPSDDDGVDNAGILIVKETKPGHGHDEEHHPPSSVHDANPSISALEESFGGPQKGTTTITKLVGILNSGQPSSNEHQEEDHTNYYPEHKDHESPSSNPAPETIYDAGPPPPALLNYNQQSPESDQKHNYQDYRPEGEIYDSYGMKLAPSAPQLIGPTDNHQSNHNHESLAIQQLQSLLNPHFNVPKLQENKDFKDTPNFADYNYQGNLHLSEPLKIPILDHHQNSVDHSHDHQDSSLNYYGLPNYGTAGSTSLESIGSHNNNAQLPILSSFNNYQLHNPVGIDHHAYNSAAGPAVFGVWGRMTRRIGGVGKKSVRSNKGLEIQRSVGYSLRNSKLTRI